MHGQEVSRERKQAGWSIALTCVFMPLLTAMFLRGPQWPVFVFSLAFMAGYIVERLRLSRAMISLIKQLESAPSAGLASTQGRA